MIMKRFGVGSILFLSVLLIPMDSFPQQERKLNLNELIDEALQRNPEIVATKARAQVYREKVPQAGALEDPMLGFGIVNLPTNFSFRDEDMTMKEFSISQKLPFPGKRPLMSVDLPEPSAPMMPIRRSVGVR